MGEQGLVVGVQVKQDCSPVEAGDGFIYASYFYRCLKFSCYKVYKKYYYAINTGLNPRRMMNIKVENLTYVSDLGKIL